MSNNSKRWPSHPLYFAALLISKSIILVLYIIVFKCLILNLQLDLTLSVTLKNGK